ncbi:MAG TPA: hypothetical protein VHK91_01395 [Flavisolibacter sp.]|jgi:hypothetical protein|nr:hypothetical protein [Flavisolibacter sp.]
MRSVFLFLSVTIWTGAYAQIPGQSDSAFQSGDSLFKAGNYEKAIWAYRKSLEENTGRVPPVFIKASLAKAYALNKDSTSALDLLTDMVYKGPYGNFPDLDTAKAFVWLKANPRFVAIRTKAYNNAFPCIGDPKNQEFDFWVGEWNVYQTGTDYQVGHQKIEKASGGCMVLENWTATGVPNEGKSMNFISPDTRKWEQVWMGSGGIYLHYYNGSYSDQAMRFEGAGNDKAGKPLLFHLTYFNLSPATLRQLLEQSADGGKTWTTVYDFSYKRLQ